MLEAGRQSLRNEPRAVAIVVRRVVWADWLFTATTIVFQPLSGLYMLHLTQMPVTTPWVVMGSFALYFLAGACLSGGSCRRCGRWSAAGPRSCPARRHSPD